MTDGSRLTRRAFLGAAAGAGGVAATGTAASQSTSLGSWLSGVSNFDGVVDRRGEDEVTVQVGVQANGGPYGYGPAAVRVDPGTSITFEWVSNTHNVVVESQPSGADWAGITDIHNQGYSASHTFETEGVHLYYCRPHEPLGMKGAVVVGDVEVSAGGGDGGGGIDWTPPGTAHEQTVLAIAAGTLGVAALAVLGGEAVASRRERKRAREAEIPEGGVSHTEEATPAEPARTLDHDEYDPTGTASLIAVYVAILALLWLFMYFVEFLGNGPTVVG